MNKFKQHIPNFVDFGKAPEWIEFETTEDLLNLEVVQRYSKRRDFSHFAISGDLLISILDKGYKWWVVGYIEDPTVVDLPKWQPKYKAD